MDDSPATDKRMRLRFAGTCRVCGEGITAGTLAIYERATRTVRCERHVHDSASAGASESATEPGTPGASARREYERRRARREARVRERFPVFGDLLLALAGDNQPTAAWQSGARGEEALGRGLNALSSERLRLLHDRRIPGTRANIDHLAVTTYGVYVIDAKHYQDRPRLTFERDLTGARRSRLVIGSRDGTKLVEGMRRQMDVVRGLVPDDVPVQGVLCFVGTGWAHRRKGFGTGGVGVLPLRPLFTALTTVGDLPIESVEGIHRTLAKRLRPA